RTDADARRGNEAGRNQIGCEPRSSRSDGGYCSPVQRPCAGYARLTIYCRSANAAAFGNFQTDGEHAMSKSYRLMDREGTCTFHKIKTGKKWVGRVCQHED